MGSSLGRVFRVTTFGESHGKEIGCVVENCPAGMPLNEADIQPQLDRRRPGQNVLTTPRKEQDGVKILSGVFEGKTIGSPIALAIENTNTRGHDYQDLKNVYRPSHADYSYQARYGHRAYTGGGRASARTTAALVAAGAIARKMLIAKTNMRIAAWVARVEDIALPQDFFLNLDEVISENEKNDVRCPHQVTAAKMSECILSARKDRDSLGGLVELRVENIPAGWGDPVFDRLDADLAKVMMAIPAVKAVEIGSGLAGTFLRGSTHNDPFTVKEQNGEKKIATLQNFSGGIQGGISNGEPIVVRVGFKPTPTIGKEQQTVDNKLNKVVLQARGRHDPCVLPRAVPIVEAAACLILADHYLRTQTTCYNNF